MFLWLLFSKQNSIKFVKEVVLEDETKLKGIPPEDCSKIMLWSLRFHAAGGATTTKRQINQWKRQVLVGGKIT